MGDEAFEQLAFQSLIKTCGCDCRFVRRGGERDAHWTGKPTLHAVPTNGLAQHVGQATIDTLAARASPLQTGLAQDQREEDCGAGRIASRIDEERL